MELLLEFCDCIGQRSKFTSVLNDCVAYFGEVRCVWIVDFVERTRYVVKQFGLVVCVFDKVLTQMAKEVKYVADWSQFGRTVVLVRLKIGKTISAVDAVVCAVRKR